MYRNSRTLSTEHSPTAEGLSLPSHWCHSADSLSVTRMAKGHISPDSDSSAGGHSQSLLPQGLCALPTTHTKICCTAAHPQIVTLGYVTAFNMQNAVQM